MTDASSMVDKRVTNTPCFTKLTAPNAVAKVDNRTPHEIIGSIEQQGRIVSEALMRLTALLAAKE